MIDNVSESIFHLHALVGWKWSAKISAMIQLFYKCKNKTMHYNCNTTVLLRREFYLRKVFETPLNNYIWLAKRGNIYSSYFQARRKQ